MRCKGIEVSFRIPIREYDCHGNKYDHNSYSAAAKKMVGVPVTNEYGTICYGIVTDVSIWNDNDYFDVTAMLFAGGTIGWEKAEDGVIMTKSISALALAEDWKASCTILEGANECEVKKPADL